VFDAEPPGWPSEGPSNPFEPAGDRPSDLVGAVLLHEVETISARTKAALAALKATGVKLGRPVGHKRTGGDIAVAQEANVEEARRRAEALRETMGELEGLSANAAAAELNRRGVLAVRGGRWTAKQVIRARQRLERPVVAIHQRNQSGAH
jgi:DNA invertase Pin-like site-specific DNA recombinase